MAGPLSHPSALPEERIMLSRKSRKSAGRNTSPAKIQPSRRGQRKSRVELVTERLEDRTMMSIDVWTGAGSDGNWGTANNWLINGAPGTPVSNDTLVFPALSPTVAGG